MQQLLGHVCALLPAGLLLQRSAQRIMRSFWRWLTLTCAITTVLTNDIVQDTENQFCLSAKHTHPQSATEQTERSDKGGAADPLQPHSPEL